MTRPIRIGVLLQPGIAPDFASWRSAVLHAEELGADPVRDHRRGPKPHAGLATPRLFPVEVVSRQQAGHKRRRSRRLGGSSRP
jgi:hypothetical protein